MERGTWGEGRGERDVGRGMWGREDREVSVVACSAGCCLGRGGRDVRYVNAFETIPTRGGGGSALLGNLVLWGAKPYILYINVLVLVTCRFVLIMQYPTPPPPPPPISV